MKTFLIYFLLAALFLTSCRHSAPVSRPEPTLRVKVTGLISEKISLPVHSTGILTSAEELKLSFKTGGIVSSVKVKEGDHVRKGDLLAALDLSEISAGVEQAKNGYEKALRDLGRVENLFRDSVATLEQKQNATTALSVAKSTYDVAKFNLSHSRITAPDNGVILKLLVRKNELVAPGYPVFLFGTSGKQWRVKSGLSDRDIIKINPGDSASVSFDAYPGIKFSAFVDQVGGIANPNTGTYETELVLNDAGYRLASGFIAGVEIYPGNKKQFTFVPIGAIVEAEGLQGYVYSVTDSMTARKIRINIITIDGSMAAVDGIPGGVKEVVSEGAAWLNDGSRVVVESGIKRNKK